MKTRVKLLKVKIKSLAAEARIIRQEERRAAGDNDLRCSLWAHRVGIVRREQRLSLLAYAFLRGRPLAAAEPKRASEPDWERVGKLVEKFGTALYGQTRQQQDQDFQAWLAAATQPAA